MVGALPAVEDIHEMADLMWSTGRRDHAEEAIRSEIFAEVLQDMADDFLTSSNPMRYYELTVGICMARRMYANGFGHHMVYDA